MPASDLITRIRRLRPEQQQWLRKNMDEDPIFADVVISMFPELLEMLGQAPPGAGQIPSAQPPTEQTPPQRMPPTVANPAPPASQTAVPGVSPQQNPLARVR